MIVEYPNARKCQSFCFVRLCRLTALFCVFYAIFFSRWLALLMRTSSVTRLNSPYKRGRLVRKTNKKTTKALKPTPVDRWGLWPSVSLQGWMFINVQNSLENGHDRLLDCIKKLSGIYVEFGRHMHGGLHETLGFRNNSKMVFLDAPTCHALFQCGDRVVPHQLGSLHPHLRFLLWLNWL